MRGMLRRGLILSGLVLAASPATAQFRSPSPLPWRQTAPTAAPAPLAPSPLPERPPLLATGGEPAVEAALPAPAPMPREENLTTFNPLAVELKRVQDRWVLQAGGTVLKDFGPNEGEARQAWVLIRELRLTQHGTIGSPKPVMEYWLRDGRPPQSLPRGIRTVSLNTSGLRTEQMQGFWVLRESGRILFNFGAQAREAEQALAVIRKYGFNEVGVVGRAGPAMLVLVSRPEQRATRLASPGNSSAQPVERFGLRQGKPGWPNDEKPLTAKTAGPVMYPTPIVPPLRGSTATASSTGEERFPQRRSLQQPGMASGAQMNTHRIPFDWRQAQLQRDGEAWKLAVGSLELARFRTEREARLAHAALMHYRLTERHLVGGPESGLGYFLSSGQAPRGTMVGLLGDPFHPEEVAVRQVGSRYCVTENGRPLLDCGPRKGDAEQMVQVIRRHGFDHVYRIGTDDQQGLTFLARSH